MRRLLLVALLALAVGIPVATSNIASRGYAQVTAGQAPQGDEFNSNVFGAPFKVQCAPLATQPCPDTQSSTTWSLDANGSGQLRIWTQLGSLFGTPAQSSNNARNLVLQPFDPATDWTATTKVAFPATSGTFTTLGQTAGLIVYQDADNFIYVGRTITAQGSAVIQFVQEVGGADLVTTVPEQGLPSVTVYLRLVKTGTLYQAAYSYDNVTFVPIPAATAATATATSTTTPMTGTAATATVTNTPVPTGYTASYSAPQIGLTAFGGTNTAVSSNAIAADFDWFRVGNSQVAAPTPLPTSTGTVSATSTTTTTATGTSTSTATSTVTNTPVATSTATVAPTSTNTPIPTPTPKPVVRPSVPRFQWVSLWYHVVRVRTFDFINFQGGPRTKMGIWAHINFPSGVHKDYYENTNGRGYWSKRFAIPGNAWSRHSTRAVITLQLWHGNRTRKNFVNFVVIR